MASVTKRGNSYRIRVLKGRDSTGKQVFESTTFTPDPTKTEKQNQRALEQFIITFEQRVRDGKYLDGEKITFREFAEIWLREYASDHLAPGTLNSYKDSLSLHVLPEIGSMKLSKIQPRTLIRLYKELTDKPSPSGKPLSASTVRRIHAIISSIYTTAVRWNVCADNPCTRTEPPRISRDAENIKYFTLEETERFLSLLDKPMACPRKAHDRIDDTGKPYHVGEYVEFQPIPTQMKLFFYMALFLGCRRGELIALQWQDVDFKKQSVSIHKSASYSKGQLLIKEPKNRTSIREISVPSFLLDMMKSWRSEQMRIALSLGTAWEGKRRKEDFEQNFLFIQWNGKTMHPSTPYHAFQKIIRRYNATLPAGEKPLPAIPLHGLRHTSATMLISQNVDVRTVSGRLGHSQTSTTMNIYAHSLKKMDELAAEALENLLIKKNG